MREAEVGDEVKVVRGKHALERGLVFWVGASRFGDGTRVGLKNSEGKTLWAAQDELKRLLDDAGPQLSGFDQPVRGSSTYELHLRFRDAPEDPALEHLGRRWARFRPAGSSAPWSFDGHLARCQFAPAEGSPDALAALQKLLLELHDEEPIVEAALLDIEASVPEGREIEGEFAPSPAFAVGMKLAAPPALISAREKLHGSAQRAGFSLLEADPPPRGYEQDRFPGWTADWLPEASTALLQGTPRAPRLDDPGVQVLHLPVTGKAPLPEQLFCLGPLELSPGRLLVGLGDRERLGSHRRPTWLGVSEGKELHRVWRSEDEDEGILAYAWLDATHAVLTTRRRTVVVAVDSEVSPELDHCRGSGELIRVFPEGLVAIQGDGVALHVWLEGKLRRLGRLKARGLYLDPCSLSAPVFCLEPRTDQDRLAWELAGVERRLQKER